MKEIRGARALGYARGNGIRFDIDQDYLAEAEANLRGGRASMVEVSELLEERVGRHFRADEIIAGGESFDFLINRYGDEWIYVAIEGDDPEAEERVTLRLFRRLLKEADPVSGTNAKDLLERYGRPRFGETGFAREASLNLLFHAALRLSEKGLLVEIGDPEALPAGQKASYGRRSFSLVADLEISLAGVLCASCRRERLSSFLNLHQECAKRLRKALTKASARTEGL